MSKKKQPAPADVLRGQILPALKAKGWNRKQFADVLGMGESQLSTVISIGNPNFATVVRLAEGLGISIETHPGREKRCR
jgi:transcriptional regulator with XRE-family HTH domain